MNIHDKDNAIEKLDVGEQSSLSEEHVELQNFLY